MTEPEWDESRCHSCGERFSPSSERAEVVRDGERMLVHQSCMEEGDELA